MAIAGVTAFYATLFAFLGASPATHYIYGWGGYVGISGLALLLLFYVAAVWWHELGHYVAGRLMGFQLVVFSAWPLVFYPKAHGWSVRRHKQLSGSVFDIPTWPVADTFPLRYAFTLGAGPLSSLGMATLALGVERALGWYALPPEVLTQPQQLVGLSLWVVMLAGLICFFTTLFPYTGAGYKSDGMQLLQLLFGTKGWHKTEAVHHFCAMQASPLSPKDWDRDLIARLADFDDEALRAHALVADYYLTLEQHSPAEAEPRLEDCLKLLPLKDTVLAAALCAEAAFHYAVYRGDLDKAKAWLEEAEAAPNRKRTEAAVAYLAGDTETALTHVDEALSELNTKVGTRFDTGIAQAERRWLLKLRGQILEVQSEPVENVKPNGHLLGSSPEQPQAFS